MVENGGGRVCVRVNVRAKVKARVKANKQGFLQKNKGGETVLIELPGEEYSQLLAENLAEVVYVGNKAYKLYPLRMRDWLLIKKSFAEVVKKINTDAPLIDVILEGIEQTLPAVLMQLGVPKSETEKLSTLQIQHLVSVLYRQNFDLSKLPEESKKNVLAVLDMLKEIMRPILEELESFKGAFQTFLKEAPINENGNEAKKQIS